MVTLVIAVFICGYAAIALEHPLKLNKAAAALITGILCWTIYAWHVPSGSDLNTELLHHLGEIASIIFFLLGAMTIVELIDSNHGFDILTQRIRTRSKRKLLWIIVVLTFLFSALLDNLTTAIVMVSLSSKLLSDREDRLWFAGMIIIAANAGGAWSPLGDVTTTMLWIGRQITPLNIMKELIFPSIAVCLVPTLLVARRFRGQTLPLRQPPARSARELSEGRIILVSGIALLLFVPAFKTVTHLPPFMGMLLALGIMWIVITILLKGRDPDAVRRYTVTHALEKIDTPSILFFLGILLAVAALQSFGVLQQLAGALDRHLGNDYKIGVSLGILSSIVDNVPLVAAAQGMYDLSTYPTDHHLWEFLALTTGTGGSAIIIGSAAGVAAMGIEKIDFIWYLRKISLLALIGFAAGIAVFLVQLELFG